MSTRSTRRRKVVLPVTVIRNSGEKQVAHTLDVTSASARLGGVYTPIKPGEVIEIQRGAARAKFRVVWIGSARSAMAGQAGLQGLFTFKNIWGVDIPLDEPDNVTNVELLRSIYPLVRTSPSEAEESRWHRRFRCTGSASVMAVGYGHPVYAEIRDISLGGVYLKSSTAFPVNTKVHLKMDIAGIAVEMSGMVRASDPLVGMGIGFQRGSRANEEKLTMAVGSLQSQSAAKPGVADEKGTSLVLPVAP